MFAISSSTGLTFTIELLYITSSSVFQLGFCSGLTIIKSSTAASPNVSGKLTTTLMTKLLYMTLVTLLLSCAQTETKQQLVETTKESKFKSLLTKYKDISVDTLNVYSAEDLESNSYKFKGTQLDSADVSLFPKTLSEQYFYDHGFFACYKFALDTIRTALITRTPSTYEPSSVKLLIFDKQKDSVTDFVELAETFGDAGDYAEKTSWLFKDERNKYINFMWYQESHDNSVDDEKDTTIQTWNYYYLFDISKSKVDTANKNEKELLTKFGKLLKGKASR